MGGETRSTGDGGLQLWQVNSGGWDPSVRLFSSLRAVLRGGTEDGGRPVQEKGVPAPTPLSCLGREVQE